MLSQACSGAQGLSTGHASGGNAIENNWLSTVAYGLGAAYLAYEWERSNVVTDEGIVSDPVGEAVLLGGLAAGAKGLAKGLAKAGKGLVQAVQESKVIGNEVGAVGDISRLKADKLADSAGEKAADAAGGR
ncbi:hypothetical protein EBS43_07740 [bacterium]|nr:hypothetical protein [bacterium]